MRADFLEAVQRQSRSNEAFCLATVVKVVGSASAKTGSKAIFSANGRNVFGWIGGGCAESFVAEQSLEAIKERRPRTVFADLDDEIFGLGIACGGTMEIFIEPIFPEESVALNVDSTYRPEAEFLAKCFGWKIQGESGTQVKIEDQESLLLGLAAAIAKTRGGAFVSLRECKELPIRFAKPDYPIRFSKLTILGKGRIVENLARFGALAGWKVEVVAPGLNIEDYPEKVRCKCLNESYSELSFKSDSAVLIASHHASDSLFVEQALNSNATYVGMIGSRKRAIEVIQHLKLAETLAKIPLFVPAGLDLDARSPEEIALSVIAELIQLKRKSQ